MSHVKQTAGPLGQTHFSDALEVADPPQHHSCWRTQAPFRSVLETVHVEVPVPIESHAHDLPQEHCS